MHTVYDAGGPVDGNGGAHSVIADHVANTIERVKLPLSLRVPGAVYCSDADCSAENLLTNPTGGGAGGSSGAIVPAQPWGLTEGWQGLLGQDSFMEFGMKPFAATENGGIAGHVIYASTRPFDDPSLSLQLQWEPGVPHVTINLYQEGVDADGNKKLTLVDTTTTTSWDDWAQGFRPDAAGNLMQQADGSYIPNMNCPGQDPTQSLLCHLARQQAVARHGRRDRQEEVARQQLAVQVLSTAGRSSTRSSPRPMTASTQFPSVTAVIRRRPPADRHRTTARLRTNCSICIANPRRRQSDAARPASTWLR